jgi:transposase
MALGKRSPKQTDLWIPTDKLAQASRHPFYAKLNEVLDKAKFDDFAEELCRPYYAEKLGRPGIAPGLYFRMLLIGYFEGIESQRGIAWRVQDSLSLREFLGLSLTERTPDHSALTKIRQRLDEPVYNEVFLFVLKMLEGNKLLKGKTLGIDATTLEANAAMKSIVRKDGGENWNEYLKQLAEAEGVKEADMATLRKMDRKRKGKKVSNKDWKHPKDPDARIAKMKDGRTRMAYKSEHSVDMDTQAIVAISIDHADQGDTTTGPESLIEAQGNLMEVHQSNVTREVVADKGYHSNQFLSDCNEIGVRTYIL